MVRLCLALVALLSGCGAQQMPTQTLAERAESNWAISHPIGRYQMQPGVNPASVAVLDTRMGTVMNCIIVGSRYHCLRQDNGGEAQ